MYARLTSNQRRAITVEKMWGPWGNTPYIAAGQTVNRASATQLLACFGSAQLIVNEISTLPVDGPSWLDEPTPDLNRISWLSQIVSSMVFDGTAYVAAMPNEVFLPLDAQKVTPRRINGRKEFIIGGQVAPWPIIEIPCMILAGQEKGLSPVECARHSIGLGLAAQQYGGDFFEAGPGNIPGAIQAPREMQPDQKRDIASQAQKKLQKGGRGLPFVLDDGMTWNPTTISNEQAQFLQTRGFTAAEIAGQVFMVDPSELGIPTQGVSLTYQNLAQRNTRRITFTCMPHIRRIETAFAPWAREFRFNVDARLRGDTKTSYETLAIALNAGFMTVDEVRDILGFPPLPPEATVTDIGTKLAKTQLLALLKENPVAA